MSVYPRGSLGGGTARGPNVALGNTSFSGEGTGPGVGIRDDNVLITQKEDFLSGLEDRGDRYGGKTSTVS